MKFNKLLLFCLLVLGMSGSVSAIQTKVLLNDNWMFRFSHDVEYNSERRVDLPHTWNDVDALVGMLDYKRGIGNYRKNIFIRPEWAGKRLFLRFEGVNTVADVFVNGKFQGEHKGGYGAFVFEITNQVNYGKDNSLLVRVSNAERLDIMPLVGDFNFYGGIYRDVHLLITDEVCISPLDYASSGVYLIQKSVSEEKAEIDAKVILSNASEKDEKCDVRVRVLDGSKLIIEKKAECIIPSGTNFSELIIPLSIKKPHLWAGKEDPFMYRTEISLYNKGKEIDRSVQPMGLRYYSLDPDKGFFLNGKHLKLKGVCRHQDRSELGNALHKEDHEEDMAIIDEMGANAIRLAHYPQAEYVYDLADKYGFVVWAEIPFVGPGGYEDKGFVNMDSFKENGKEQLKELIRQHYNHPSICFWGLFNELKEFGDNPVEYIKELNELAHSEDPTRPTTSASNTGGALNLITDMIAWNRYDGWYGGTPAGLGEWLDNTHREFPQLKIGISEYGAGASIYHQQDSLVKSVPNSWWHPENWQTHYHMENWKILAERPYVWGSFVWNMFDFGAAHRKEGDKKGRNDKGLVTFDRRVRKDAFYFYKANWNTNEKTLYLADKRNTLRKNKNTDIMAFSNVRSLELFVNGKSIGVQSPDKYATVVWQNVSLQEGKNQIEVRSVDKKEKLSDCCIWNLDL